MKDYKAILEANRDNVGLLGALASEINAWDNSLEHLDFYEFGDEFFNMFFDGKPIEAAKAVFYGNIDSWGDEWIRFDGYGNLESLSDYEREQVLLDNADDIIGRALELADNINIDWCLSGHVHEEAGA